jgi:hypothetical protein
MIEFHELPSIDDLHKTLGDLIEAGFGGLKVQVVAVPKVTITVLASKAAESTDHPASSEDAVMVEYALPGRKLGIALVSTERDDLRAIVGK